ncbi:MAG: NAD(P)/FAD-dependent oxidoreductase [Candidatus Spechtbacterales bacterium]
MKNIIVLGAGFAGLRTAIKLGKKLNNLGDYRVILIDKETYHTYTPSLYEVASAYRGSKIEKHETHKIESELAGSVCFSISDILGKQKISFIKGEVVDINTDTRSVILKSDEAIQYEYCVLALGSQVAHYNVEGSEAYCASLKTVHDALEIRTAIQALIRRAGTQNKDELRIATIGAGLTGFELTTEIVKWISHLRSSVPGIKKTKIEILMVDAEDKILTEVPDKMRRLAEKRLDNLGIKVVTKAKIIRVEPHQITMENGRTVRTDFVLWGGGVKGLELFSNIRGLSLAKSRRVEATAFLQAKGQTRVFVAGDSAHIVDKERDIPVPATAWAAEQEADAVADNIFRSIKGQPLKEYVTKYPGFVSSAGGKYGVAHLYGVAFAGFFAWAVKRVIDLKYILSLYTPVKGLGIWLKELKLFTRND